MNNLTYSKTPGVYFTESVEASVTPEAIRPCFIVQTSTTIAAIDDQLVKFDDVASFKTVIGDNLPKSYKFINQAITEETGDNGTGFYVYSIKTDTADAFRAILTETINKPFIRKFTYIEETASSTNGLDDKITALNGGAVECARRGVNRLVTVVPYGTVATAISGATSGTPVQTTIMNTLKTSIYDENLSYGRVVVVVPTEDAGIAVGRINATPFYEEPGYKQFNTSINALDVEFTPSQVLTLQNYGFVVIAQEAYAGTEIYRINLGATLAFSKTTNTRDGLIISRSIADELLTQVAYICQRYVKRIEGEQSINDINDEITEVVEEFIEGGYVEPNTYLGATAGPQYTVQLKGEILPYGCIIAINVDTILGA